MKIHVVLNYSLKVLKKMIKNRMGDIFPDFCSIMLMLRETQASNWELLLGFMLVAEEVEERHGHWTGQRG